MLWVLFACLTAIVLLVLLRPLVATKGSDAEREAFNAAVYRDQLGEVESDRERGLIAQPEADSARVEIGRRLLATDGVGASPRREEARAPAWVIMIAVAAALPALAFGLYLTYGSPRLPDQPLAARLQDPASDQNLEALVARVEARLREHPEEGDGWEVIAPIYMAWRRYTDAAEAYGHAVRLLGESPKRLSGYGQALVLANDGVVSEEARRALERAVALDPNLVEPRILLAIAKEQDGKFAEAIEDWRGLLGTSEGDAPWRKMVEKRVAVDEAHLTGKPVAGIEEPATAGAGPQGQDAPSASDIAAAQSMSPAERQAMIEQMVQGLAARLDREGNDLGGWLKLVRAYSVLDRKDDAVKALAKAKVQFGGDSQALQQLDALAAELGLKS
ncbi:MAG: c-type cytochrome biogenesis protein CcmI [Methyloceanibacter sp.]